MDAEQALPRIDQFEHYEEPASQVFSSENTAESLDALQTSYWDRARHFVSRHKGKLALGAAAASATLTFALNPMEEVQHEVIDAAPAVGVGIVASEVMFVGGMVMMASSVGNKVGNPLKLRERLPEICEQANDSKLFKAGFWVNATGAVGSAAILSAGVIAKLPPESYGVLSIAAADIAVTVAVRKAMLDGIRNNTKKEQKLTED
jgi:hypothetical protein